MSHPCHFCQRSFAEWDYYMVHRDVWRNAGLALEQTCCLRCLEERTGRPLNIQDFAVAPVNRLAFAGAGLQKEFDVMLETQKHEQMRRALHKAAKRKLQRLSG